MRSCLILGSGRSGTSMLAGVLSNAGYYMGSNLWPARDANPKGFFEDLEVNWINEQILATVLPRRPARLFGMLHRSRPVLWQRWLADVPLGTDVRATPDLAGRMARETANRPFCFKDPRFCYTLPAWREFVGDAAFICIFRNPAETVDSILREVREAPYLRDLRITPAGALRAWTSMYQHVLEQHSRSGDWLFVHYDQVLDGSAAERLEALLGVAGDWTFPEPRFRRAVTDRSMGRGSDRVYEELCRRAGRDDPTPARRYPEPARFQEAEIPLSTRNIFDLGVVDLFEDGHLAVFTTNHNSRQTLLANRGGGAFVDVVDQLGLNHDRAVAGWDDDVTLPPRRRDGVYLYRRGNTTVVQRIGGSDDTVARIELGFVSQVRIGQQELADVEILPDGSGAKVSCSLQAGAQVDLTPDLVGAPMAVRIDGEWPLHQLYVGSEEVNPSSRSFALQLRDRHSMAWMHTGTEGLGAVVARGGLKGRLEEFPGLVADEVLVRRGSRFEDVNVGACLDKGGCRSRQVAWVNLDQSGAPSLFVSCAGGSPRLYRQGDGLSFVDVSSAVGLDQIAGSTFTWVDIDGDGRPALLAVDGDELTAYRRVDDGPFAVIQTVRLRNNGDGIARLAVGDWRSEGCPDIFAPSRSGNTLLLNEGGVLRAVDPSSVGLPASGAITAHWVDYDNDGLVDLHLLPGGLFRQVPAGQFRATSLLAALLPSPVADARATWFDAENSGRRDLLVAVATEPKLRGGDFTWRTAFLRNTGPSGHWLQIELVGAGANRLAIGAAVTVGAGERATTQWVGCNEGSHFSSGHYRLYFGLGGNPVATAIDVRWPDGSTQQLGQRGDELVRVAQSPAIARPPKEIPA